MTQADIDRITFLATKMGNADLRRSGLGDQDMAKLSPEEQTEYRILVAKGSVELLANRPQRILAAGADNLPGLEEWPVLPKYQKEI